MIITFDMFVWYLVAAIRAGFFFFTQQLPTNHNCPRFTKTGIADDDKKEAEGDYYLIAVTRPGLRLTQEHHII